MPNPIVNQNYQAGGGGTTQTGGGEQGYSDPADMMAQRAARVQEQQRRQAEIAANHAAQANASRLADQEHPFNEQNRAIDDYTARVLGRAMPTAPGAARADAANLEQTAGPTAYGVDPYLAQRSGVTGRQLSLADQLQGIASGKIDRGTQEVRREMDAQRSSILGAAGQARPGQGAAAQRFALQKIAQLESAGANEAAMRNAAYQAQARGELGTLLGQTRGQDISEAGNEANAVNAARGLTAQLGTQTSVAGAQLSAAQAAERAHLQQQTSLANAGFEQNAGQFGAQLGLQGQGQQDQMVTQLMNQRAQLIDMQQRGQISREQLQNQMAMLDKELDNRIRVANITHEDSGGGGFWSTLGGIAGAALPVIGGIAGSFVGQPAAGAAIGGLAGGALSGAMSGGGGGGGNIMADTGASALTGSLAGGGGMMADRTNVY